MGLNVISITKPARPKGEVANYTIYFFHAIDVTISQGILNSTNGDRQGNIRSSLNYILSYVFTLFIGNCKPV